MEGQTMTKLIESVEKGRSNHGATLDSAIPTLLDRARAIVEKKRVGIQLYPAGIPLNGADVYYLFSSGIVRISKSYNKEGAPYSQETPVAYDEFLNWVKGGGGRFEALLVQLKEYDHVPPLEPNFPTDDIL